MFYSLINWIILRILGKNILNNIEYSLNNIEYYSENLNKFEYFE